MTVDITDDDILYAEQLLLKPGESFNGERRDFIRSMESRDVVACPGSGKTTALLAKILILAKKMPFADGRGICVLTHTNVAINEIKKKAGVAANSLFRYPNFFGTIHSFVGTYLAIPAYVETFGHRQIRIDDDLYGHRASYFFRREGLEYNGAIFNQVKRRIDNKPRKEQLEIKKDFFIDLVFNFEGDYVSYCRGDTNNTVVKGSKNPSKSYLPIHNAKYGLLNEGYLRYNDIFPLATGYVKRNPNLQKIFSNRFSFVFFDEMQDTDNNQSKVIDSIFLPNQKMIVQKIGDPNQAIFKNSNLDGNWSPQKPLFFSDSIRYGEKISHILNAIRVHTDISLKGSDSIKSSPAQIITFKTGEEKFVIEAFAKLIQNFNLPQGKYCAVGWIQQNNVEEGKLCIPAYFPKYCKALKKPTTQFSNLISYSTYAIIIAKSENVKEFFEVILHGISHSLDAASIKTESNRMYTPKSAESFWKQKDVTAFYEFRSKISMLYIQSRNSTLTPIFLRDFIAMAISPIWHIQNPEKIEFLSSNSIDAITKIDVKEPVNQVELGTGSSISVGTVHSVKGETHIATLYLETYYQKYTDSERLMEFLKGNRPKGIKKHLNQNLKVAHVAFSRPKQLVVFACQVSSIIGHEEDLLKNGWEINSVSDLIKK
nr:UvrD-helicase domain-containing protein [uncultured Methanoregula sp.]